MLRNLQLSSKRKSRTLTHSSTEEELPSSKSEGVESVTMRRKFSNEDSALPRITPRKRSSAELGSDNFDSNKCLVSKTDLSHYHSDGNLPSANKKSLTSKFDRIEKGDAEPKEGLTRPSHIDLKGTNVCQGKNSEIESPAFKSSNLFLFRNAFELDDRMQLPKDEPMMRGLKGKELFRETREGHLTCKGIEQSTKDDDNNYEDIFNSMKKSTEDLLKLISLSKSSTLEDDCFVSLDDSIVLYGTDKETLFDLKARRTKSLSESSILSPCSDSNDDSKPFHLEESQDNENCRYSLDESSREKTWSFKNKRVRTLTFGRHSLTEGKKKISFRRSLSESQQKKYAIKNQDRSDSLKKHSRFRDGSFFKGILKKRGASRSHSDGSDKGTSPWHSRRPGGQGGAQQGFEGGGGSAPTSPQTGTKLSKLPFWKRGSSKQGKNQLENSSESIPDKDASPIHSMSPVQTFGSPIHTNELNLHAQLKKNYQHLYDCNKDSTRDEELRKENSIKIRIQEAKGIPDKRSYYCVLLINGREEKETTVKHKDGICFWGEMFEIYNLHEVRKIGIRLLREDNKRIGLCEFEPVPSIQNPKLDEWVKVLPEKHSKDKDKDDIAIRIRYTFQKVTILPLVDYKRFTKYLKESSLTLCRRLETLLNAKAKEDFVTSLINILQYNKKAVSFLNQLIISDVKQTGDNDKVLFRANSMATKAIEVYMRLVGENYLETTLQEPLNWIIHTTKDMEVDCTKMHNEFSPLEERQKNLLEAVEVVWMNILKSPKFFPAEIQEVFFAVRETLRNNDSFSRLISASVFLRLLCPAVMTPHLFGLIKEYPEPAVNRRLTLVAKTLQTLANFSTFQLKEDCMQFLNIFIERETENCRKFLANISGPRPVDMNTESFQKDIYVGRHLALLHLQLKDVLSTADVQATDTEIRQLLTQLNHIDDCLTRREKLGTPRHQENLSKIGTSFMYRSPPMFRRSVSENPAKGPHKLPSRGDESPLRSLDYNRPFNSGTTRGCCDGKEVTSNSFLTRKNAAADLSTSDNYVLQSALITHRDSGSNNINVLNNNIESNLNYNQETNSKESNGHYVIENYAELNSQSQDHHTLTSRPESRSSLTSRKTREKSLSASTDVSTNHILHELEWNNQILTITRDIENNMKGSHSNLSQVSGKTSGYHSISYSPSSSPIEHQLTNNCYMVPPNSNNINPSFQVSSSPLSSSSSSGIIMVTRACSPHESPIHSKQTSKFRHGTPVKHNLYHHSVSNQPSPPQTPPLNGKLSPYIGNRSSSYSPEPLIATNECLRRQLPLRRRSPSSSSSSSPTSPTIRRTSPRDQSNRSSGIATPRTNPHCSPCKFTYPKAWRNSPTRRKSSSQAETSVRFSDSREDEINLPPRDSRGSWSQVSHQEDHMQAILQRLITMEQEMRQEQDILLQEMNAKDRLLAEQERHIAALDTANSQLIRTIASLTATQNGDSRSKVPPDNQNASTSSSTEPAVDISLDSSCNASDMSDGKCSSC